MAQSLRVQGMRLVGRPDLPTGVTAFVRVRVGEDGFVESVEPLEAASEDLGRYAQADAAQWQFKPYVAEGKPTPFYFFTSVEPRKASNVVACPSKAWLPFKEALRNFCAGNKKASSCYAGIGECGKNQEGRVLPIRIPADHDDFEYVIEADEGDARVARFHWEDGWVVTDVIATSAAYVY